ncbi:Fumarylacetoacetase [Yarrowia sp. B02]|nr:Fumarylacetoacetase [Yarrowia sp. B02]
MFSIDNIPFGVVSINDSAPTVATIIDGWVYDLRALGESQLFQSIPGVPAALKSATLNDFAALGNEATVALKKELREFVAKDTAHKTPCVFSESKITAFHLPFHIPDYTDFYASKVHATNVGVLFRGKDSALQPNWVHLPVGYHGRASSVVVSGTDFLRPQGQIANPGAGAPVVAPCKKMDYEVELACFIGKPNKMGQPISVEDAHKHIFGYVVMNDWSARDIQAWEYVPLGPFLGKNFCTSISPWVVTPDALVGAEIELKRDAEDPPLASYLDGGKQIFDIDFEVSVNDKKVGVCNAKDLYWSFPQMIAHHTVGGCPLSTGDLLGSGTISSIGDSGDALTTVGSLLEATHNGTKPIEGISFLKDGDVVTISARAKNGVDLGSCTGAVLPSSS